MLDPVSVVLQADACWYLYVARRWETAERRCREALALDPRHPGAHRYLLLTLVARDRWDEAGEVARRLASMLDLPESARVHAARGREAVEALRRSQLARLLEEAARGAGRADRLALAWLRVGELDRAEAHLVEAFRSESGWIRAFLGVYPELDPLRERPEIARLMEERKRASSALPPVPTE